MADLDSTLKLLVEWIVGLKVKVRSWHFQDTSRTNKIFTLHKRVVASGTITWKEQRNKIVENRTGSGIHLIQNIFVQTKLTPDKLKIKITMGLVEDFNHYRSKMNEKIMDSDSLIIKRIFNLDTNAYAEGNLDVKSKELIGLTCSLVLRCDDCVRYHLGKCKDVGFTTAEVHEAMGVATLIGGTIVIPHLRRAFEYWEELQNV